jgi:transposase
MPLIWLAGLQKPDHVTLWRFFEAHKELIKNLFKQSVQVAHQAGLVGLELQAVDGTRLQAIASTHTGRSKERLTKLLAALDKEAAEATAAIEKAGVEAGSETVHLTGEALQRDKLRQKISAELKSMEELRRDYYQPTEAEARRMKCESRNRFAYNAQIVVDKKAGIITAQKVINHENDEGQLVPMIDESQENIGQKTAVTVADGGYGSGHDLLQAKEAGHEVLVPPREGTPVGDNRFHAHNFVYDEQTHSVRCPEGRELDFARQTKQKGQMVNVFRCKHVDCPVREQCSKDRHGRRIEIWLHTAAVQEQRNKLRELEGKKKYAQRREIVEKEFADIKEHGRFRRWTHWGLARVRTQWSMVCLAHNLKILYRQWKQKLAQTTSVSMAAHAKGGLGGNFHAFCTSALCQRLKSVRRELIKVIKVSAKIFLLPLRATTTTA